MPGSQHINFCIHKRANPEYPSCGARGSEQLLEKLKIALKEADVAIEIRPVHCLSACNKGPNLLVVPSGRLVNNFSEADIQELVEYIKSL